MCLWMQTLIVSHAGIWPFDNNSLNTMYDGKMVICSFSVTIEMNATEQYFPVVLFILLYKMALTFECVENEIPKWDHLNESY